MKQNVIEWDSVEWDHCKKVVEWDSLHDMRVESLCEAREKMRHIFCQWLNVSGERYVYEYVYVYVYGRMLAEAYVCTHVRICVCVVYGPPFVYKRCFRVCEDEGRSHLQSVAAITRCHLQSVAAITRCSGKSCIPKRTFFCL